MEKFKGSTLNDMVKFEKLVEEADFFFKKDDSINLEEKIDRLFSSTDLSENIFKSNKLYSHDEAESMLIENLNDRMMYQVVFNALTKVGEAYTPRKPVKYLEDNVKDVLNRSNQILETIEKNIDNQINKALHKNTAQDDTLRLMKEVNEQRKVLNNEYTKQRLELVKLQRQYTVIPMSELNVRLKFIVRSQLTYLFKKMVLLLTIIFGSALSASAIAKSFLPSGNDMVISGAAMLRTGAIEGDAALAGVGKNVIQMGDLVTSITDKVDAVVGYFVGPELLAPIKIIATISFFAMLLGKSALMIKDYTDKRMTEAEFVAMEKTNNLAYVNYNKKLDMLKAKVIKIKLTRENRSSFNV